MKVEFSEQDLVGVVTDHLRNQGMNMKGRTVRISSKSTYLGKGKGTRVIVVAEISEPLSGPVEPVEEEDREGPMFGED